MKVRAGTSGWSYDEWKGSFYPETLKSKERLHYYAEHFSTVEVNNTFYRMPRPDVLDTWAAEVPPDFEFVLKASRRISHDQRLAGVEDNVDFLLRNAARLGPRLGPILVQLPPSLKKDVPRLRAALGLFEPPVRVAVEFRHPSWYDDETWDALRDFDAVWCVADTGAADDPPFVSTAGWGYLRLRRGDYSDDDLQAWAAIVRDQPWEEAFVFFKHEEAGTAPRLATRFLELTGELRPVAGPGDDG
jgi:uncharacterized protein YecE (DUF72 family)